MRRIPPAAQERNAIITADGPSARTADSLSANSPLEDEPAAPSPLSDGPVTAITYYYLNGLRVAEQRDGVWTWTHSDHLR